MLIELINKGSVPYCGSNDNNSTGVSLSEILFSFMSEKCIVSDACGLRSPNSNLVACYIHLYLFRAGIDKTRNGTKMRKVLLSMHEEHLTCRI